MNIFHGREKTILPISLLIYYAKKCIILLGISVIANRFQTHPQKERF